MHCIYIVQHTHYDSDLTLWTVFFEGLGPPSSQRGSWEQTGLTNKKKEPIGNCVRTDFFSLPLLSFFLSIINHYESGNWASVPSHPCQRYIYSTAPKALRCSITLTTYLSASYEHLPPSRPPVLVFLNLKIGTAYTAGAAQCRSPHESPPPTALSSSQTGVPTSSFSRIRSSTMALQTGFLGGP